MTPGGGDDIRFLLCACGRGTLVGVIAPGMLPIQVIGLLDCVGGHWDVLIGWAGCHGGRG